jgi:hypothetical protein
MPMAIKLKWKTREEIPAELQERAAEENGEFVFEIEDVPELKNAHERQKEENRTFKEKVRDLEKQLKDAKAKAGGLTDEEIAARRAEIEAETKPIAEKLEAAQKELRTLKFDDKLKAMIGTSGANPKRVNDLHKLIGDRFDLNDSGTLVLKDKPTTDLAKYLAEDIPKEYSEFYESKQKGGVEFKGSGNGAPSSADTEKLLATNPAALLQMANAK